MRLLSTTSTSVWSKSDPHRRYELSGSTVTHWSPSWTIMVANRWTAQKAIDGLPAEIVLTDKLAIDLPSAN